MKFGHHRANADERAIAWIREQEQRITDDQDLDSLIEAAGDSRVVLLGEASHGTAEYYDWRRRITKRLIEEKGFNFVAVEGDWPDCYRVNQYVKDHPEAGVSAFDVLHAFDRWPTWMWANRQVVDLVEWMAEWNRNRPHDRRAGFYGLDVYSLWDSLDAVMGYLKRVDPDALDDARRAYECFEPYGEDVQAYARATALVPTTCEDEIVAMLMSLRKKAAMYKEDSADDWFNAEQNAIVAKNAERYYRAMVRMGPESWNVRDIHMVETLERLLKFYGPNAKAIVWEHNTHIGDARATDMATAGMVNVGQLVRERNPEPDVYAVGFGGYRGQVIAANAWGAPMRRMLVPEARDGSYEALFHEAGGYDKLVIFRDAPFSESLRTRRGHRAIGVVYHPEFDHQSNYVPTDLVGRYDAFVYFDGTRGVDPLHLTEAPDHDAPVTYPSGF